MARQLTFDLPPRPAMGRDDFFVSTANASAVALVDGWRDWPHGKLVLTGARGAGKTHLAHVWAGQSGARIVVATDAVDLTDLPPALVVEDCEAVAGDPVAEERLFHLHNAALGKDVPLLFTARSAPSRWGLSLPDLASRMAQAGLAHIDPPDDQLLMMVLVKQATDRSISLTPTMLSHVTARMPRDFAAITTLIAHADALALSEKKPVNSTHLRAALADLPGDPSS
ncbi:DnaA ATPase domain-containing protein [Gymnodinialimonas ulvae]|uniref:DnaA ATPase domain-containing protein n=1 Tax=Gymnodinialimonas ulvae TaxID=3126504 RepID=UPI0030B6D4C2